MTFHRVTTEARRNAAGWDRVRVLLLHPLPCLGCELSEIGRADVHHRPDGGRQVTMQVFDLPPSGRPLEVSSAAFLFADPA